MKRIKTRALALLLSCCLCLMYVLNGYEDVQAADLSAGALQYGADLSFLEGLFMSAGAGALGLDMLLKTKNDINNWDWGEVLDSPASQGQIDKANETIEKLYNNAVKDWHEKHGGSSGPTPTPLPDVSPPVTVAPINPDDVSPPEDWGTLKKNAQGKGILAMGAATAYCVKEAVKGWWDELMDTETEFQTSDIKNPYSYVDCIGYQELRYNYNGNGDYVLKVQVYDKDHVLEYLQAKTVSVGGHPILSFEQPKFPTGQRHIYNFCSLTLRSTDKFDKVSDFVYGYNHDTLGTFYYMNQTYHFFVPVVNSNGDVIREAETKPLGKSSMWPSTDLKDDYDNNRSPNFPELATPTLRLPSLDEIKDLWKQGADDDDNRPTYVTNFITNHTVQATPEPEPTQAPGGGSSGGGSGGGSGTEKPDNPKPEDEIAPYKADIKKVFPFCIPFDLIHLFEVFDAEPEAPVFTIPIELKVDNPFTGKSIVDYEDSIKIDLSDYEQPIKVIRIFEVIFFLIGLMLITRSHMIKG